MRIPKKMLAVLTVTPLLLGMTAIGSSAWANVSLTASHAAKKPAGRAKPARRSAAQGTRTVYERQVAGLPAKFTKQKLAWTPCVNSVTNAKNKDWWTDMRCALLTVPLDYARPRGKTIKVAVDEALVAPGKKSLGILMTNPGGPGGAGLFFAAATAFGQYSYQLHDSYDIVGMNPRGLGASTDGPGSNNLSMGKGATALTCATGDVSYQRPKVPDWASDELRGYAYGAAEQEAKCQKTADGIRPYITTMNTARDMDLLRIVLGQRKTNYYGVSYGTFLGAVFGAMFPHDLNRMVLDGSMSPKVSWYDEVKYDNETIAANFDAFAAWAVKNKQGLGDSPRAVRATVDRLYKDTEKSAPTALGGYTPQKLSDDMGDFTRYRPQWKDFAASLRNALAADTGGQVSPDITQDVDSASALVPAPSEITPEGDVAGTGVYYAILCNWSWPKPDTAGYRTYQDNMDYWAKTFPYAGTVGTAAPRACTYARKPVEKLPVIDRRGPFPKGLVVAADGDTQTPLSMGTQMARTLGFDLITVTDDGTHGNAFNGNKCVTDAVLGYLADGKLPGNISCATVNPPADSTSLTSGAATAAAQDGLSGPSGDATLDTQPGQ
jgi:pimeloyl-ACP methyl ester carboxylesterase